MDLGRGTVSSLLRDLEVGRISEAASCLHGHTSFARRMVVSSVLEGHHGCVNRLALSTDGSLLLSGSDDCNLIIWSIDSGKSVVKRGSVAPGHYANIFGVAFMPETGNRLIASAGLDSQVRHTDVETGHSTLWNCHADMVKTVHPLDTHNFITASKDGTARLVDVRQSPSIDPPVVASVTEELGRMVPLSSGILSPINSNHLLVAASDAYTRIFDLRAPPVPGRLLGNSDAINDHCLEVYSPLHLHVSTPQTISWSGMRNIQSTYANFSSDARQIVASYFDDAVFVFDRWQQSGSTFCTPPFQSKSRREKAIAQFGCQAAACVLSQKFEQAANAAKRVLELDENDMFALLCLAISLPKCNLQSDPRFAYGYFSKALRQLEKDQCSVLRLWNCSESLFSKQEIQSMADVWKLILEYLRVDQLLLLCPPLYQGQAAHDRLVQDLTVNRLNYLNGIAEGMISLCNRILVSPEKSKEKFVELVTHRALGLPASRGALVNSRYPRLRVDVLRTLVRKFTYGIVRIREKIMHFREPMLSRSEARWTLDYVVAYSDDSGSSGSEPEAGSAESISLNPRFACRSRHFAIQQILENNPLAAELTDSGRADELKLWGPLELQEGCRRFHGHVSRETEIKEANFYGSKNQVVLSGSDDGKVYLWSSTTGALLSCVEADDQIVNCVMGHPYQTMIIASGIDDTIKVLTPGRKIIPTLATYPSDQDEYS